MRFLTLITGIFIGLSGCSLFEEPTKPIPRPNGLKPAPEVPLASIESQQISAYYASVQARLLSQGLLRQETKPSDAIFTTSELVENFERIALFDEYSILEWPGETKAVDEFFADKPDVKVQTLQWNNTPAGYIVKK